MSSLLELQAVAASAPAEGMLLCGRRVIEEAFFGVRRNGPPRTGFSYRCWQYKPVSDFHPLASSKDGKRDGCKECAATARMALDKATSTGLLGEERWLRYRYTGKRSSARVRGQVVTVSFQEFAADWYRDKAACAECGESMDVAVAGSMTPTYDRRDATIHDYVSGNGQWLHFGCNSRKGQREKALLALQTEKPAFAGYSRTSPASAAVIRQPKAKCWPTQNIACL